MLVLRRQDLWKMPIRSRLPATCSAVLLITRGHRPKACHVYAALAGRDTIMTPSAQQIDSQFEITLWHHHIMHQPSDCDTEMQRAGGGWPQPHTCAGDAASSSLLLVTSSRSSFLYRAPAISLRTCTDKHTTQNTPSQHSVSRPPPPTHLLLHMHAIVPAGGGTRRHAGSSCSTTH